MILLADGRQFQIAGTVLSDGTTIIPMAAITLGQRPAEFPLPTTGVTPPILYIELIIDDAPPIVAAMSVSEYNQFAIAEAVRINNAQPRSVLHTLASGVARTVGCRACGSK